MSDYFFPLTEDQIRHLRDELNESVFVVNSNVIERSYQPESTGVILSGEEAKDRYLQLLGLTEQAIVESQFKGISFVVVEGSGVTFAHPPVSEMTPEQIELENLKKKVDTGRLISTTIKKDEIKKIIGETFVKTTGKEVKIITGDSSCSRWEHQPIGQGETSIVKGDGVAWIINGTDSENNGVRFGVRDSRAENNIDVLGIRVREYRGLDVLSGVPVIDPGSGKIIASVRPRTVYIHFNLRMVLDNLGADDARTFLGRLSQAVTDVWMTLEDMSVTIQAFDAIDNLTKARFTEVCSGNVERARIELEKAIEVYKKRIETLTRDLYTAYNTLNTSQKRIEQFKADKDAVAKSMAESLEMIKMMDDVAGVYIFSNKDVCVITKDIICEGIDDKSSSKPKKYYLGKLAINFIMSSSENYDVKIYNLNNFNGNQHAGHVWRNGNVCWGQLSVPITEAVASQQFHVAVPLILNFLKYANVNDELGKGVKEYPIVNDKDNKFDTRGVR